MKSNMKQFLIIRFRLLYNLINYNEFIEDPGLFSRLMKEDIDMLVKELAKLKDKQENTV